ncbi:acyltransferase domain-containing protein [Kitasatospora sp. NBC_01287]|uniref:ACP S-malonyltransferase n=1 Tax=Kitasatospora sp. NBC_01287 TaxID=2903573 RepID=UPI002255DED7|nr:acyltransferase domain-containing protein [Kitasatospora sp. NBC_01287]MCX4744400.1 acyltransferase domain-containing protein [Kitasatospora sp. NBC_01287]
MPRPGDAVVRPGTVHAFPGQGDFPLSPLPRALVAVPELRAAVAEVFRAADPAGAEFGVRPLGPWLLAPAPPSGAALAAEVPGTAQLALFGLCLAAHRALARCGLPADRLLAVSFGEIPALTAAGALAVPDGARLACRLGQLLHTAPGGLTVLRASAPRVRALLARCGAREVVVACVNDAGETVISGPPAALLDAERAAGAAGVEAARLRLPFRAHHPELREQAAAFEAFARALPWRPPRLPVHSAVAGRAYQTGSDLPRALADCLVRPAELPPVLRQAVGPGTLVLETGTGRALSESIRRTVPGARIRAPIADSARGAARPTDASVPHTRTARGGCP